MLGVPPYLPSSTGPGSRKVMFHEEHLVERFPRVLSLTRVLDALEINRKRQTTPPT